MTKKSKIPTLAAILILVFGVALGVILIRSQQIFKIGADIAFNPKDIRISNVSESSFTVSWITEKETLGLLRWGSSSSQLSKATFDENEQEDFMHSVTISNLSPDKTYFFTIQSGSLRYDSSGIPWKVKTSKSGYSKPTANFITGTVVTKSGIPVKRALVYAVTSGGSLLSTATSDNGTWILDISQTKNQSQDVNIPVDNKQSLIEITVQAGPLGIASAQTYPYLAKPLPSIVLGESHNYKFIQNDNVNLVPTSAISTPLSPLSYSKKTPDSKPLIQSLTVGAVLLIISVAAVILCSFIFIYFIRLDHNSNYSRHA